MIGKSETRVRGLYQAQEHEAVQARAQRTEGKKDTATGEKVSCGTWQTTSSGCLLTVEVDDGSDEDREDSGGHAHHFLIGSCLGQAPAGLGNFWPRCGGQGHAAPSHMLDVVVSQAAVVYGGQVQ